MSIRRTLIVLTTAGLVAGSATAWWAWGNWSRTFQPNPPLPTTIFISPASAETASVTTVEAGNLLTGDSVFDRATERIRLWRNWRIRPGRYTIQPGATAAEWAATLNLGLRDEVRVVVPAHRDLGVVARSIAGPILADSASVRQALTADTLAWKIIPNTYHMWWESTAADVAHRLVSEHKRWWTPERTAAAAHLSLTPREVTILASIVQEETARLEEAPYVAGLYLNRLARGMLLQADPTLKFAADDWSIRRVLDVHKTIDSPFNTYLYPGLPPAPIRIPEWRYLEAVLSAESHSYLYMCARPDGSGYHDFAARYSTHQRNARRYQQSLNRDGVYR